MNIANLIEPSSAAIVFGGTLLGTVLRSGWTDCRAALAALGNLRRSRFDGARVRSLLAGQLREIQQDGLVRARPEPFGDAQFDETMELLVGTRSGERLFEAHDKHRERRTRTAERAIRTIAQAAELAPVFGLAATLVSLSQLPADGLARHAYMGAIGMAVSATLYGLLLANLVLIPLGRAVERAAADEEAERHDIVRWLVGQLPTVLPQSKPMAVVEALAA